MKAEKAKIEAFEIWCWRRTLKISWTEKIKIILRFSGE
jgi:hypothetical protein